MATDVIWQRRRDIQQAALNLLAYHEEPIEGGDPKAADLLCVLEDAVVAYGRAVREADKGAARGVPPQQTGGLDKYDAAWIAGNWAGRREAVVAIEALEEKP